MFWSGNAAIVLFDLNLTPTGYEYIHLADRFLSLYVFLVAGWWLIESFLTKSNASSKETSPRAIHIHTANLNLDTETLAPYKEDLIALIKSYKPITLELSECVSTPIAERVDFPALYEATTLEKVREACPCGAEARAECYAFKGIDAS